jgi:hypothetical protein
MRNLLAKVPQAAKASWARWSSSVFELPAAGHMRNTPAYADELLDRFGEAEVRWHMIVESPRKGPGQRRR